jgi:L-fucose isomerase-like protein
MNRLRIGFVTCVHPLFDLPGVAERRQGAMDGLRRSGCEVVATEIPRTPQDALDVAAHLRQSEVDLAVLFFCTWVAEGVTLTLARELMDVPLLLWALPYLDRDLPMPSPMTGLTASGSNIRRLGKRFAYMIGGVTPASLEQVIRAARVGAVVGALRRARFGIIGSPCPGMLDVEVEEAELEKALGAVAIHFELDALLQSAQAVSLGEAARAAQRLSAFVGGSERAQRAGRMPALPEEISEETLTDNLRLYVALKEMVRENRLDAYCVRCWPELRDQHRITPCTAHALLAEEGVPSTCEVDLPALITTWILSRLADAPAFNFDITGYLEEEGAVQFAHCGAAAPSLAEHPGQVRLRRHMRTGTGATVEFPFREGTVTLAKLLRPANGPGNRKLRLFVAGGGVVPSGEGARGAVATLRPEPSAAAFIDKWMREAVEHHIALVYGSWKRDLELFCEFTGVECVPV